MAYAPKPAELYAANLNELKKRIKEKRLSGTYVFFGDEEYTKTYYFDALIKASGTSMLNVTNIFGTDFNLDDFINACDTAPASGDMFSDEEAQSDFRVVRLMSPNLDILTKKSRKNDADGAESDDKKGGSLTEDCEKLFFPRVEDPDDGVILVFWLHAGEDAKLSTKLYKRICEAGLPVCFKREMIGSPTLVTWVKRHFTHAGLEIPHDVAVFFVTFVGNDMTTLKNAIDNCIEYVRFDGRNCVTEEDVRTVCRQSVTAQIFDISNFCVGGQYARALAAFRVFEADGEPELVLFGTIVRTVQQLCVVDRLYRDGLPVQEIAARAGIKEYFVRGNIDTLKKRNAAGGDYAARASELCEEYDAKLKMGSKTNGYALLEELIFKLAV